MRLPCLLLVSLSVVAATPEIATGDAGGGAPRAPVSATDTDPRTGDLWTATLGEGLVRSSAGRLDRFTQFNSALAGDQVLDVKVWEGRVWSATGSGISSYDPRSDRWALYLPRRSDAPPPVVVRFAVVPQGPHGGAGSTTLAGVSAAGSFLRYDAASDDWIAAEEALHPAIAASAREPRSLASAPRAASGGRGIAIGLLAPMARPIAAPGDALPGPAVEVSRPAVEEAIERARSRRTAGGGSPIELSSAAFQFERQGWGTPEDTLSILAQRPEVVGVVGRLGSAEGLEAELALRLELPVVDTAPDEPRGGGEASAWVFRCDRYGHASQGALLDALLDASRPPRIVVVRTPGEATTRRLDYWTRRARERGHPVAAELDWDPAAGGPAPLVARMRRARANVVLTWTDAPTAALLLRAMRGQGMRAALVGSERIVGDEFVADAPREAGAVLAVAPCRHAVPDAGADELRERSFLAAAHLLAAIEVAGPDRGAVRRTLERMRSEGVARLEDGVWRFGPAR